MFKRIIIVLAGLFAILGFIATPPANAEEVGVVVLYERPGFDRDGNFVERDEAQIPTSCSAIPSNLATVRSAQNQTSGPGTSMSFYTASTCSPASHVATVAPGGSNPDINSPTGAGFWRVTP